MRLALLGAGAMVLLIGFDSQEEPSSRKRAFIGAEQCKLCHRDVYQSWAKTPHARTPEWLSTSSPDCLPCHATGDMLVPSIQCEACHGPGEDYWPLEVMMDPEKAAMAGLERPGQVKCRSCHVHSLPSHKKDFEMPGESDRAKWIH